MKAPDKIKEEILSTIRGNLAASKRIEANRHEHRRDDLQVDTGSQDKKIHSTGDIRAEFQANLESVGGRSSIVNNTEDAAVVLQKIVDDLGYIKIAVSDSADVKAVTDLILPDSASISGYVDSHELFGCTLGITSAQWAIAETGTLVLDSEKEFNRLTSLIPEVHVCVLRAQNIRQTMSEILEILGNDLSRTVTLITGPSRTSDIELTLAIGVHGPRELHVITIHEDQ